MIKERGNLNTGIAHATRNGQLMVRGLFYLRLAIEQRHTRAGFAEIGGGRIKALGGARIGLGL